MPESQVDEALGVNVKVPMLLTAAFARSMVERGSGSIVNVGSINGTVDVDVAVLCAASKSALHSATKSWAAELASQGVGRTYLSFGAAPPT